MAVSTYPIGATIVVDGDSYTVWSEHPVPGRYWAFRRTEGGLIWLPVRRDTSNGRAAAISWKEARD